MMIQLIQALRQKSWANYYIIFTRFLIGFAFIPSGMVKMVGKRFTTLPLTDPVGAFFEAMYQTGIYWNFLGFMQLLASFMLFSQRFAVAGAWLFFGIITNIFLITVGVGFGNTAYITGLMWLATITLVLWDWDKVMQLLSPRGATPLTFKADLIEPKWGKIGLAIFAVLLGFAAWMHTSWFIPRLGVFYYLLPPILLAILVGVGWLRSRKISR